MTADRAQRSEPAVASDPAAGGDDPIDFDAYRTRARTLRSQAIGDAVRLPGVRAVLLTIIAVLTVSAILAAAPIRHPSGRSATATTDATTLR